jgi:5'-nucleotidase
LILITNDDGILAPGLAALHASLSKMGPCVVVAPDAERSAVGHAITMAMPLRVLKVMRAGKLFGYAVSGTPADCVKMAFSAHLIPRPTLVVSGINLGPNVGTNVLYSGTVSAATEAAMLGVPSIAVSLDAFVQADFRPAGLWARRVAAQVIKRGLPPNTLLNVNVPNLPTARIKGSRITRQGSFRFEDKLVKRLDPHGKDYFWLAGSREIRSKSDEFDDRALEAGFVSITPVDYDMTHHAFVPEMEAWKF